MKIAILGAGMMGTAIAATYVRHGIPVLLYDTSAESLRAAPDRIAEELRLRGETLDADMIFRTESLDDAATRDILIETIPEKLRAKRKLYRALAERETEGVVLTNTSTISITALAEGFSDHTDKTDDLRRRFCGLHFFHPVRENSLVEIIPGADTAPETVRAAELHARTIGKRPIVVRDGPGFLVNRILNAYLSTALALLEEGAGMARIERVATDFGMRMGPMRIMDEIGLDVVLHAGWILHKAFPDRVPRSPLLLDLVERGRLGRKSGRGFMVYPNKNSWDGDGVPDETIAVTENKADDSDDEIVRKLFGAMYREAARCIEDGVVDDPALVDLASIHALGFPERKGGILRWGRFHYIKTESEPRP